MLKKILMVGGATLVAGSLAVAPAFATTSVINDSRRSGDSAFVRNSWVQAGLKADGTFGSNEDNVVPSGFTPTTVDGPTNSIGLIADGDEDGTFEQGDFFLPGSPYEGWSIKVGDNASRGSNDSGSEEVPGNWISSETDGDASVTWQSIDEVNGIAITQNVSAPAAGDHLFHITATLTNNSGSEQTVYYMRQVDPDNGVDPYLRDNPDGPDADYSTFNTILANDDTAQVVTGTSYYNYSTIGYRAADPDASVRISDWSDPLSSTDDPSTPLTVSEMDARLDRFSTDYKVGFQDFTDSTIDIAFRKVIANGASATVEFDYILSPTLVGVPELALDLSLDLSVGGDYAEAGTALAGGGLAPNSAYTLTEHSDPRVIFNGTTLPNGNFYDETALPTECIPGSHTLILSGTSPAGATVSDWVTYTVDDNCSVTAFDPFAKANGAPNPDAVSEAAELAKTGLQVSSYVGLAGLLALMGAGVSVVIARRKRA